MTQFYDTMYQDGYYYRRENKDGSNGMYDLISNTCGKISAVILSGIILTGQEERWNENSVVACYGLLRIPQRWPERMDSHWSTTKTLFERVINRARNKLFGANLPFRFKGLMTRDPYTNWALAAMLTGQVSLIKLVKIPWYIRTPSFMAWWKFLQTGKGKYLKAYRFLEFLDAGLMWRLGIKDKDYVLWLNACREECIKRKWTGYSH